MSKKFDILGIFFLYDELYPIWQICWQFLSLKFFDYLLHWSFQAFQLETFFVFWCMKHCDLHHIQME